MTFKMNAKLNVAIKRNFVLQSVVGGGNLTFERKLLLLLHDRDVLECHFSSESFFDILKNLTF